MTDVFMRIMLSANSGSSISVIQSVASSLTSSGGLAGAALKVSAVLAGAAIAFGVASVKMAADYEATMNKVQALAGLSKTQADAATESILKMSTEVGQTPQQLADALYYIASAGFSAKDSLLILEGSAKAAAVGMVDTQVVANAVTASMKALNIPASQTQQVLDMMTKTVATGKTEWKDYAGVVGKLALNAAQAKISFGEANSAFAELTNVMPSSRQAADSLNALLQTSSRFDLLTSRAKSMGLTFDTNAYKSMNLENRMKYLKEITGGNTEELTKLLGRQNAQAALTALSTNNFKDYDAALKSINNNSGAAEAAFQKVSGGLNMSTQKLGAAFDVLKIRLGTALLPIITNIVTHITPLVTAFTNWISAGGGASQIMGHVHDVLMGLQPVIATIGNFLSSTFVPVWKDLVSVYQTQIVPAFNQLMVAIRPVLPQLEAFGKVIGGIVIVVLIILVALIAGLVTGFARVLPGLAQMVVGITQIFSGLVQIISGIIALIIDVCTGKFGKLRGDIDLIFKGISVACQGVWNMMVGIFRAGIDGIIGFVTGFGSTLINIFMNLWNTLVGHSIVPDMINGIVGYFAQLPGRALAFIMNLYSQGVGLFNAFMAAGIAIASNIVSGIANQIAQLPGRAVAGINNFISTAQGILNNFVSGCAQIGANIVNFIADGINGAISNVTSAITNVTDAIASFLPKSPAKRGELANLDKYGPALVGGFATGIVQSLPLMLNAMGKLTTPISTAIKNPITASESGISGSSSVAASATSSTGNGKAVYITIQQLSPELHIHNNGTLTPEQVTQLMADAMPQLNILLGDAIRLQFGNV